jgi:hypothetical protein
VYPTMSVNMMAACLRSCMCVLNRIYRNNITHETMDSNDIGHAKQGSHMTASDRYYLNNHSKYNGSHYPSINFFLPINYTFRVIPNRNELHMNFFKNTCHVNWVPVSILNHQPGK